MGGYGTASRGIAQYGNITFTATGIFRDIAYPVYYLLYSQVDAETTPLDSAYNTIMFWCFHTYELLFDYVFIVTLFLIDITLHSNSLKSARDREDSLMIAKENISSFAVLNANFSSCCTSFRH
jgi:hypothetical protein